MTAMGSFAVFILKLDILTADPEVIAIEKGTLGGGVARHSHVNVRVGSPEKCWVVRGSYHRSR
jgi:hypothetical protein